MPDGDAETRFCLSLIRAGSENTWNEPVSSLPTSRVWLVKMFAPFYQVEHEVLRRTPLTPRSGRGAGPGINGSNYEILAWLDKFEAL